MILPDPHSEPAGLVLFIAVVITLAFWLAFIVASAYQLWRVW